MIIAFKLIQKILNKLPFWGIKILAVVIAFFLSFNLRRKKKAYYNLKTAFPEKSYREISVILKKNYLNFALSLLEFLIPARFYPYIELDGADKLKQPGICAGIHAGSWELVNFYFAQSYKFVILANRQKSRKFDFFLNNLRRQENLKVVFGLKHFVKSLKQNYWGGLVVDHGAEKNALICEFFGQMVPMPAGAVFLAEKLKKHIYIFFPLRLGFFNHKIKLLAVIEPGLRGKQELVSYINKLYQKELTFNPQQYLWWHKLFKHKQNRKVLILDDKRPGHFKQSNALFMILAEQKEYQLEKKVVLVKYRNRLARILANIYASFCPFFWPKAFFGLGLFLTKDSFQQLSTEFFDIVISTGNLTAPINKIVSSSLGARSASILHTNLPPSKFDLAVIPEHDRLYLSQAVKIRGALTYPLDLEKKKAACSNFFKFTSDKKIAFFLGGPSFDSQEFKRKLTYFLKQLKSFSLHKGYKLLVSTSLRTPVFAENEIKKQLNGFNNLEALVIARESNYNFVFDGFVLHADLVFCSSESVSMLTEIASLQKPCICTFLESLDDKRKVFLDSLKNDLNFLSYPFNIKDENLKVSDIFGENKKKVKEPAQRLFSL